MSNIFGRSAVSALVVATLGAVSWVVHHQTHDVVLLSYWYLGAGVIAACLITFVIGRRYTKNPIAPGRVLCIVPSYNEDPQALKETVMAILAQTVPVDIVVIDDGSRTPVIPSVDHPRVTWLRQENKGKRGAQVTVLRRFDRSEYQFIMTVDSDSAPYPDACEHLLRAMSNPRIQAATGMIYIRNHGAGWVTLAADIDIGTSCVMMRASRSMLGALETTSGALALYRSDLLYDHLNAYEVECGTGDDRWLALRALRRGEVVAVAEAIVETDMPTTLNGTYRQRLRWARSWWWMLPYVFRHMTPKKLLSPLYGLMQLLITPAIALYILTETVLSLGGRYAGHGYVLAIYIGAYVIVRYAGSALYLIGRPNLSMRQKLLCWFVGTPGAIILNVFLLTPIRYIALAKLFDNRWQTRELDATALSPQQI
ncbi:glycosyltransferase family 2 protein [Arthrobacter bambusae]|uniref:glycosyltransferase family 2 protein n=1 Tax=Arthrobacter bambusae TaxID=1338426 RepID=UPI00278131DD|nr:glycosyltransferase family 2 protein [Arthrobacter bambusae]MDQ0031464.1 hyaluronan synthase [Arthrobacter bambusae]MDQ0099648.1 hyaluronan synthase [Arthrobacter bambusae]